MHVRLFSLPLGAVLLSTLALSQAQQQQQIVRRADGGTSGRMESIFVPPKAGAPFSLTLATEWSRPMGNGGTFTLANERRIVRDSKGRIYQERWILVPKGSKIKSQMDVFQITDPEQHTWYNCITALKGAGFTSTAWRRPTSFSRRWGRLGHCPTAADSEPIPTSVKAAPRVSIRTVIAKPSL